MVDICPSSSQQLSEPETMWWVQVRSRSGRVGWTYEPEAFENKDACGGTVTDAAGAPIFGGVNPSAEEVESLLARAELLFSQLRYNEARELCQQAMALDPANVKAKVLLRSIERTVAIAGARTSARIESIADKGSGGGAMDPGFIDSGASSSASTRQPLVDRVPLQAEGGEGSEARRSAQEREAGSVNLRVSPMDASVYLDGRFLGTGSEVSQLRAGLLVDPGLRRFEFVRPGFISQVRSVNVSPGEELTLRVDLVRN